MSNSVKIAVDFNDKQPHYIALSEAFRDKHRYAFNGLEDKYDKMAVSLTEAPFPFHNELCLVCNARMGKGAAYYAVASYSDKDGRFAVCAHPDCVEVLIDKRKR